MSTNYKADFPLLAQRDVAYLDSAATAQRPQCVLDAEREFYTRHNANPLRGLYPLSIEATEALESARAAVARFLGAAQSEEIVFTRNTTEGLNLVAYSYGLSHVKAGDEILISTMEHHSNILPWQMVCRQTGAQLKFMECEPDGSLDLNKVEALITARTRVVALQQVSNVLGREYSIRAVAELAHRGRAEHAAPAGQRTGAGRGLPRLLRPQALRAHGHRGAVRAARASGGDAAVSHGRRDDRVRHARGRGVCRGAAQI